MIMSDHAKLIKEFAVEMIKNILSTAKDKIADTVAASTTAAEEKMPDTNAEKMRAAKELSTTLSKVAKRKGVTASPKEIERSLMSYSSPAGLKTDQAARLAKAVLPVVGLDDPALASKQADDLKKYVGVLVKGSKKSPKSGKLPQPGEPTKETGKPIPAVQTQPTGSTKGTKSATKSGTK